VRDARQEARDRLRGRFDVRVLEPSPPAVEQPPYCADDPVAGGEVVPVERPGCTSWARLCRAAEPSLTEWCQERWLVRRPLAPLPDTFPATRAALHAVAEHLLAPGRHAANGKIGLRFTYRGFGTPFFAHDRQLRVEDGDLVDGDRSQPVTTLGEASAFLGVRAGAPEGLYRPTTPCDLEAPLAVDATAARALGDWFGFCASVLEQLRAEATEADAAARVQLWPEHFDLAVDMGPAGARANFGGSPGDAGHPEPYLYVGPFERRTGDFWNEPFGASLSYRDLLGGADALSFLRHGKELLGP
jgi:hypothetical protein